MNIEYDKKANALYLYLSSKKQKVGKTKEVAKDILLDLDAKGKPIGLEILAVSEKLRPVDLFHFSVKALEREGI